jgi:hypothetical protein
MPPSGGLKETIMSSLVILDSTEVQNLKIVLEGDADLYQPLIDLFNGVFMLPMKDEIIAKWAAIERNGVQFGDVNAETLFRLTNGEYGYFYSQFMTADEVTTFCNAFIEISKNAEGNVVIALDKIMHNVIVAMQHEAESMDFNPEIFMSGNWLKWTDNYWFAKVDPKAPGNQPFSYTLKIDKVWENPVSGAITCTQDGTAGKFKIVIDYGIPAIVFTRDFGNYADTNYSYEAFKITVSDPDADRMYRTEFRLASG